MKQQIQEALSQFKKSKLYKRIAKNFSISLGGTAFSMLIRLGNMSFLTKALTVEDYGNVHIVTTFCSFVLLFLDIKTELVVYRYMSRFKKEGKNHELVGIFWMAVILCFVVGSLLSALLFFSADWVSIAFYNNTELAPLIRIFSFSVFFAIFSNISAAILRMNDRFKDLVIPQSISVLLVFILIVSVYFWEGSLTKEQVITIDLIGVIAADIPPFILAFVLMRQFGISLPTALQDLKSLKPFRKEITSMLFHTNISGSLKIGTDKGGMFLLGIFASPTEVAYFSIAKNVLRPIHLLQRNFNTALSPEIYNLFGEKNYKKLQALITRFFNMNIAIGTVLAIGVVLLAGPVLSVFATEEYLEALPNLYFQLGTLFLSFISIPYYALTVAMGDLKRRNFFQVVQVLCIGIVIPFGFNAITLAASQFLGAIVVRLGADVYVFNKFRKLCVAAKVPVTDTSVPKVS